MKLDEFIALMLERGWVRDRFGHLQKTINLKISGEVKPILHRVKLQKISVRLERRTLLDTTGEKRWYLMSSCYTKDITMNDNGGIVVGRVTIGKGKANVEQTA